MLMRKFWPDYMVKRENRFPSLEAYTEYRVQKDWSMNMEEAQKKAHNMLMQNLIPYDKARFGDLPQILADYVEN